MSRGSHIREQGLTTKKCIATHTNCFLKLKTALYSSALVMKLFNNRRKLF